MTKSVPTMLCCGTPDKTVALQTDRNPSITRRRGLPVPRLTEVISQQRLSKTGFINSF